MTFTFFRHLCFIFIFVILLHIEHKPVFAQTEKKSQKNSFWINTGLGLSSLGSIGGTASFSIQSKKIIFSLRGTANSEKTGIFNGGDEFFDVGLLTGIASQREKYHASFSMGIARVTGSQYIKSSGGFLFGGTRENIHPTIGLPMESQLFLKLSRLLGIGFVIYCNMNKEESFGGITLNLVVGSLR